MSVGILRHCCVLWQVTIPKQVLMDESTVESLWVCCGWGLILLYRLCVFVFNSCFRPILEVFRSSFCVSRLIPACPQVFALWQLSIIYDGRKRDTDFQDMVYS